MTREQTPPDPSPGAMREREVDENIDGSFPASDPPSWTLGTDHADDADDDDSKCP